MGPAELHAFTLIKNLIDWLEDLERPAIYADFFSQPENSGHPQALRFVREYNELVAERAERGLPPPGEDPLPLSDGEHES